jgi:hypothetical protein
MATHILPRSLSDLTDTDLVALCEEPETLATLTPLERELIVRLGALLETSGATIEALQRDVAGLAVYEPTKARKTRQTAANARLDALVSDLESGAKATIRIQ